MIKSKEDYRHYLEKDRVALNISRKKPRYLIDVVWQFQILLRRCEYYMNCRKDIVGYIYLKYLKWRYVCLSQRLGFSIAFNVFGPGLSIAHYGTIVVHSNARVGENCRIHEGVTIGATGGSDKAPILGNDIFIGTGAKIIGSIKIADGVAIGANAVVVKDIIEPNTTWAGVPAKKISNNGSRFYFIK